MNSNHQPIGICAASAFLPGKPMDLVPWAADQGVSEALVRSLLANGCRYFHQNADLSDLELIESALQRLDAPKGWQSGVRYLVHAHTQSFSMPAPPSSILVELSRRHGFSPALAFSVSQLACAAAISAIDAAAKCLAADSEAKFALVVTADRVFGDARFRLRGDTCIQSDGGSAILLGRAGIRCRLGKATFKNFTQLHDGPSTPVLAAMMAHFLGRHTAAHLREHEIASGLPLQSVDEILPTNGDRPAWQQAMQELGLADRQVFFDNIALRGHACCADLAVNLVDRGFSQLEAGRSILASGTSNIGAFAALNLHPSGKVH